MRYFFLLNCILLVSLKMHAQDSVYKKTTDSALMNLQDSLKQFEKELDALMHPEKSHFQIEVGFLSNNVFFGRKDSVATPYITPSLGYYHKSGLYINVLASYLPTSGQNRFDLFTIEAGYTHKFGNFDMQLTGSKFFYNSSSYNVESEILADVVGTFDYNFKIISAIVQGMVIFAPYTDYAASFGLEHSFYALKNKLVITPSAMANASTQNYYNSYYRFRRYSLARLEKLLNNSTLEYTITAYVFDPSKFRVLDYELSMPVSYSVKKFTLNINPVFSIPVSPAVLSVTTKRIIRPPVTRIFTEKLHNSIFVQAGISYNISRKETSHIALY